jgi:hypothetical protein
MFLRLIQKVRFLVINSEGREPEYVIESKMSLAMAAQEHLAKIQDGKGNSGSVEQKGVLDANGSFGGTAGPL